MGRAVELFGIGLFRLSVCFFVLSSAALSADLPLPGKKDPASARRVLRVALYPYIPAASSAYWAVKEAFEDRYPDVRLKITLNPYYYDTRPEKKGIFFEDADVYEIDSVFLMDFIKHGKINPIRFDWHASAGPLIPFARSAASVDGLTWGIPHWVCGNFLFYDRKDSSLGSVRTLNDLEKVIGPSPAKNQSLLIDLKGKSTLGEMYLDALMDRHGSKETALSLTNPAQIDETAVKVMARALALAATGFGRDDDYHDTTGFYARQFARKKGRALVGYSEQLHYVLAESSFSCQKQKDEDCLRQTDIEISEWPIADEGSRPISWVDMLTISAKARNETLRDAEKFIRFMMEPNTYKLFLKPAWLEAPRYLLPARDDLYKDKEILSEAPLYTRLREKIDHAIPITDVGLNGRLRAIGDKLDGLLPAAQ